ncbi:hypothetical protein [Olsenella sp. SW781]|nr:hypothetical protein [Olsenella sp. SW781]
MSDKREQVEKLQKGTAKLYAGILIAVLLVVVVWAVVSNLG